MTDSPSFTSIPTIDLSLSSSPVHRPQLLNDLRHALTSIGFLYLSNHGVPANVVSSLENDLPQLFALTDVEKNKAALINTPHFLGYSRVGSEMTGGKVDGREQLECATYLSDGRGWADMGWEWLYGPNQYPAAYPQLRPSVELYIAHLTQLGDRFLKLVSEALSIEPAQLRSFLSPQHRLKLVHYPPADTKVSGAQGVGPHKDSSGWFTFLLQAQSSNHDPTAAAANRECLQVLNHSGDWVPVPPVPGTFVVNIGQTFEVITHGICKATTHRVLSGPADRFSVPFFQGVRGNAKKSEIISALSDWARQWHEEHGAAEGNIDSAWLKSDVEQWGEWQLRTKLRSHRDVGKRWYGELYDKCTRND